VFCLAVNFAVNSELRQNSMLRCLLFWSAELMRVSVEGIFCLDCNSVLSVFEVYCTGNVLTLLGRQIN